MDGIQGLLNAQNGQQLNLSTLEIHLWRNR